MTRWTPTRFVVVNRRLIGPDDAGSIVRTVPEGLTEALAPDVVPGGRGKDGPVVEQGQAVIGDIGVRTLAPR